MKVLFLVFSLMFFSGCSSVMNNPEPCVCGPMKDVNDVPSEPV